MFATLTGAWPRALDGRDVTAQVASLLGLQAEAGLDLRSDGQLRWDSLDDAVRPPFAAHPGPTLAEAWARTAEAAAGAVVKQAVPGPCSLARRAGISTDAALDLLLPALGDLVRAGCPAIEVEEPDACAVDDDEGRAAFSEAHRRLLGAASGMHAILAVPGGSVEGLGAPTLFGLPYHAYLLDLVAGPDNWRVIAKAPAERGIVCGALRLDGRGGDPAPLLAWAVRYAASLNGRGMDRVGLANAGSLATLTPDAATDRVRALGRAARLAGLAPRDAVDAGLDPRSFDARTAALGGVVPRAARGARRRR